MFGSFDLTPLYAEILAALPMFVFIIIISFVLQVIFLQLAVKAGHGQNLSFGSVFLTWIITYLLNFIPCLGCILSCYVIGKRHDIGFGKGILAYLLSSLLPGIIELVLFWILTPSLFVQLSYFIGAAFNL
jgi:hypothetical protein